MRFTVHDVARLHTKSCEASTTHGPRKAAKWPPKSSPASPRARSGEVARLGRSLRAWKAAILAYFDTGGASNGPTESINGVIETTRRIARGFRNFENYRIRNLLAAGGHRPYRKKPANHA
nr:transposase [Arthrobacter dokdonellae]